MKNESLREIAVDESSGTKVSRRFFGAGMIASGLVSGLSVSAKDRPEGLRAASTLRLGVLLPKSAVYPELAAQWLAGALAQKEAMGLPLTLSVVDYGQRPTQAEASVSELLSRGSVDLLAGFVCSAAASQWEPLLQEHGVPLVVSDSGGNALAPGGQSPWVLCHSLGFWQTAWAAGRWSAHALGRRAMVAVAPVDSGFDMVSAFKQGTELAGGRVLASVFTHDAVGTSQLDMLARRVYTERPDVVYALAAGRQAEDFARFWLQAGLATPLVIGGMLSESFSAVPRYRAGMRSPVWSFRTEAPADLVVTTATAGPFGRLGAETVLRIGRAMAASPSPQGQDLAQALAAAMPADAALRIHAQPLASSARGPVQVQPPVSVAVCQRVCEALGSRVIGTYLVA